MKSLFRICGIALWLLTMANASWARSLYLNGIDISSARLQNLENVSVRIDGDGNVFIIAPHYQVNEETTYIPLSNWKEGTGLPEHQPPSDALNLYQSQGKSVPQEQSGEPKILTGPAGVMKQAASQPSSQGQNPSGSQVQEKPVPPLGSPKPKEENDDDEDDDSQSTKKEGKTKAQ